MIFHIQKACFQNKNWFPISLGSRITGNLPKGNAAIGTATGQYNSFRKSCTRLRSQDKCKR